jgi:hypothetical protein
LVSNGHSWSSIKDYTLSEIGVFIKSIYFIKTSEKNENLQMSWMANNLTQKGLKKVLEDMAKKVVKKEISKKEVQNEWKRLASYSQR